ncbi:MAG: Flp pilus assembly complex ATPase component TadA [Deltaproteobacteria bacterium]|nr:Flp pilus assembly complex ATPase component TadA [Deltaproteobacteria bacterium]
MILSVSQAGNGSPRRLDLQGAEVVLGKHPDCDVVLADAKVSRRHAHIVSRAGALFINDLGSTNGTKVNGKRLDGEAPLRSGDVIEIAAFRIQVDEGPAGAAPRPAQRAPAEPKPAAPKLAEKAAEAKAEEESEEAKKARMFWASMESFFQPIWQYIENPSVSEIMVNGPREIFFERKGKLERSPATFTEEGVRAAIMNVAQFMGRRVNEENPYLDARLPDGSRVAIVLPPCSRKGPSIAIRKFSKEKLTLQDLIRFGTMSEEIVQFLDIAVKLRKNMIVSGGTSSGKTSLLNIISALIPNEQRILVIEDSAELQLQQEHVLPLESKPPDKHGKGEVTLRELVRASLRLRPDRIVVGEVRGGEALDLLQAMNTGHSGSLATTHASSPLQTLSRLETLTLFSGLDLPIIAIREQVSTAIDLIIQAARLPDGSRKVTHISEVLSLTPEGKYQVQDIYRFVRTGMEGDRIVGEHRAAGNLPSFLDEIELAGFKLPPSLAELASQPGAREKVARKAGAH